MYVSLQLRNLARAVLVKNSKSGHDATLYRRRVVCGLKSQILDTMFFTLNDEDEEKWNTMADVEASLQEFHESLKENEEDEFFLLEEGASAEEFVSDILKQSQKERKFDDTTNMPGMLRTFGCWVVESKFSVHASAPSKCLLLVL